MDFNGKTAIVTGGTRGIGKGIVELFAKLNCKVIATGTGKSELPTNTEKIDYKELDFLNDVSITDFLNYISNKNIDILVNNAGINIIEHIELLETESWHKVMKVNLTGPMILIKNISKKMRNNKYGRILNISSIWGVISKEKRSSYSTSKTGLIGFTRTLAHDLGEDNILVNALCPGFTNTELTSASLSDKEIKKIITDIPIGRFAEIEEIASSAVFLCSDLNSYMTGQLFIVDGGFTIR